MTEKGLLKRIAKGDSQALSDIYDRYGRMVFSLAYHVLRDNAQAEEVTQDVFLSVWNKIDTFDETKGKFSTWLSQIARNRAIDILRRENVRPEGNSLDWDNAFWGVVDENLNVEPQVISRERASHLRQFLNELPDDQRIPISLAYYQGLSQSQIADLLKEPLGTVKTRIRLGMQKLKESVEHRLY